MKRHSGSSWGWQVGSLLTEGADPAVDTQCPTEQDDQEVKTELGMSKHPEIP